MNYLKKTFTVPLGSDAYRKNWEKAFGKKPKKLKKTSKTVSCVKAD